MISIRAKRSLDLATNVMTVVVLMLIVGFIVHHFFFSQHRSGENRNSAEKAVGKSVYLDGFEPRNADRNVILMLMKGCVYCEESMPFYLNLRDRLKNSKINLVAVFPKDDLDNSEYLKQFGVDQIHVIGSEVAGVEIDGIPTLVVTDTKGVVLRAWFGKLSAVREKEVLAFLGL